VHVSNAVDRFSTTSEFAATQQIHFK